MNERNPQGADTDRPMKNDESERVQDPQNPENPNRQGSQNPGDRRDQPGDRRDQPSGQPRERGIQPEQNPGGSQADENRRPELPSEIEEQPEIEQPEPDQQY